MNLPIKDIIDGVGKIADDLTTTNEELRQFKIEELKIDAELMQSQANINLEEAKHKSVFVAGWRPFIGWVGGIALAYQFLLYPLLTWLWKYAQSRGCLDPAITAPEPLEAGMLFTIVTGMLGIGAMRSYDKMQGKSTESISGGMSRREMRLRRKLEKMKQ